MSEEEETEDEVKPENLTPIFCSKCGNRIGWAEDGDTITNALFCDDCAEFKG